MCEKQGNPSQNNIISDYTITDNTHKLLQILKFFKRETCTGVFMASIKFWLFEIVSGLNQNGA